MSEVGQRGLCLWGGGDWNDSFNGAELQMKGESVWLSIATVKGVNDRIDLFEFKGKDAEVEYYTNQSNILKANIQKYGYDKDHYIYGYTDRDEPVGSYDAVKMLLPTNLKNNSEKSGVEPYAISNMYLGPENPSRAGESPMYWITGTSSWLFRGKVKIFIY